MAPGEAPAVFPDKLPLSGHLIHLKHLLSIPLLESVQDLNVRLDIQTKSTDQNCFSTYGTWRDFPQFSLINDRYLNI